MTNHHPIAGTAGAALGLLALLTIAPAAAAQETGAARQDTAVSQQSDSNTAEVQNPPGYRGMERPADLPADSGLASDSSAPADATSRINQRARQDSLKKSGQNPPGYRGMERPVAGDTASDTTSDTTAAAGDTAQKAGSTSSDQHHGQHSADSASGATPQQ